MLCLKISAGILAFFRRSVRDQRTPFDVPPDESGHGAKNKSTFGFIDAIKE